ncbi:MAG TPA: wax ester/triacylglycerol synthase family O-acyltransferase [Nitriliruptorales bacterium]
MHRLTGKDAIFLYMETPTNHMHVAFAGVYDPATMPGGARSGRDLYRHLVDHLESRIHLFPPFRQRLVEVPFDLDHPVFVNDPNFDLSYHVRRAALPEPGGRRELEEFVGQVVSRALDRSRPLWEMHFVEGVEGGRVAVVAKAHHVIVDGVGGNEILVNLLDLTPEPREVDAPDDWEPDEVPSDARLMAQAITHNLKSPVRATRAVARTAQTLVSVMRDKVASDDDAALVTLGPRTILNKPVGPSRAVAFGTVAFEDVRRVKDAFDVKVNDVVLAVCGRGLRRFLAELGDEPPKQLVTAVPISIRQPGDDSSGNQVAGMTVPLADDLADPVEQLQRIAAITKPIKDRLGAITADLLTDWTQFATPAVAVQAFRFYSRLNLSDRHPPVANLTISNVPGPDFPIYMAGMRMDSMYPIGPVVHGQALNITVVSYCGNMHLGVVVDGDIVPDPSGLITQMEKALGEFVEAAHAVDA